MIARIVAVTVTMPGTGSAQPDCRHGYDEYCILPESMAQPSRPARVLNNEKADRTNDMVGADVDK